MDMREREKGKFHFKIITVSVFPREKDIKIKPRRGSTAMSLSSECCLRKMNFFILFCSYLIKKIQMRFLVSLANSLLLLLPQFACCRMDFKFCHMRK